MQFESRVMQVCIFQIDSTRACGGGWLTAIIFFFFYFAIFNFLFFYFLEIDF
jgi:hypothetical protein